MNTHQFLLNYEMYIFCCISVVSKRQLNNSLTDNCKFHKLSITLVGETISFFFYSIWPKAITKIMKKDFQLGFSKNTTAY